MAIFHLSVKPISRSAGRSATAAAAYRAAEKITDERTGEIHDYTRKGGVESVDLVLPEGAPEWATDRAKLWNAAELAEKRKDACVAREYEVALPAELSPAERRRLALDFARDMAAREGCAVDVAIHAPGREGDSRNHHAHILRTTRKVTADGLGAKLDTEKAGRKRKDDLEAVRATWAELTNQALERAGRPERVDHRSLVDQGIDRDPTQHLGPAASGIERRTGEPSRKRQEFELDVMTRLAQAKAAGELERQSQDVDRSILDLSGNLEAALAERASQEAAKAKAEADASAVPPSTLALEARKTLDELAERLRKAQEKAEKAKEEEQAWRQAHRYRAKLHDAGLVSDETLKRLSFVAQYEGCEVDVLRDQIEAAQKNAEMARVMRDASISPEDGLKLHPGLRDAYTRLAWVEQIARQEGFSADQMRQVMGEMRERLAGKVEAGQPFKKDLPQVQGVKDQAPQPQPVPQPQRAPQIPRWQAPERSQDKGADHDL